MTIQLTILNSGGVYMSIAYKAEFWGTSLNGEFLKFIGMSPIKNPVIKNDYLVLDKSTFEIVNTSITPKKYDLCRITSVYEEKWALPNGEFLGFVSSVRRDTTTIVEVVPITSMLDVNIACEFPLVSSASMSNLISEQIYQACCRAYNDASRYDTVATSDDTMRINKQVYFGEVLSNPRNNAYKRDMNVYNLYSCSLDILKIYSVFWNARIVTEYNKIELYIDGPTSQRPEGTIKFIDCDNGNCVRSSVSEDTRKTCNYVTVINKAKYPLKKVNGTYEVDACVQYVRQDDGTIRPFNNDASFSANAYPEDIFLDNYTYDEAVAKAKEKLSLEAFNHTIEVSFRYDSNLINLSEMKIGDKVKIVKNGIIYYSIFTGWEINGDIITYFFGYGRNLLTKKLLMER